MSKSIYVVIGVVVAIIIAVVALQTTRQRSSPTQDSASQNGVTTEVPSPSLDTPETSGAEKTVTYSGSGFSPKTLEINVGETVTFVNQSSDDMWVASNPHPIHTRYRGFDANRAYAPNTSYSFTFTRAGSWEYHNHLSPLQGGTIIVK